MDIFHVSVVRSVRGVLIELRIDDAITPSAPKMLFVFLPYECGVFGGVKAFYAPCKHAHHTNHTKYLYFFCNICISFVLRAGALSGGALINMRRPNTALHVSLLPKTGHSYVELTAV